MPDKLKEYYETQKSDGYVPEDVSFEEYESTISTEEGFKNYYEDQKKDGYVPEDVSYEEYSSALGYTPTPEQPKGEKAESQDGGFQFLSADTNYLSESEQPIKTTPALSDDTLSLYEDYKSSIGESITESQEKNILSSLESDFNTQKRIEDNSRRRKTSRGQSYTPKYRDMSFEDYLRTEEVSQKKRELEDSFKEKNKTAFLDSLSPEDKEKLQTAITTDVLKLDERAASIKAETVIQESFLGKFTPVLEKLAQDPKALTEEEMTLLKEEGEKFVAVREDYIKKNKEIDEINQEANSFEAELTNFKRTESFLMDNVYRLNRAAAQAGSALVNFVGAQEVYQNTNISYEQALPQIFDPINNYLDGVIQEMDEVKKQDIDFNTIETPMEFLTWGKNLLIDQVPNLIASAVGAPEVAFLGMGALAGGEKVKELKTKNEFEGKNYSTQDMQNAAFVSFIKGGVEGFVENGILSRARKGLKVASKGFNKKLATEGALDAVTGTTTGFTSSTLDNIYNKYVLQDDSVHILDNWKENLAGEFLIGGGTQIASKGAPMLIHETAKAVRTARDNKTYKNNVKRANEIFEQFNSLDADSPLRKELEVKMKTLFDENVSIIEGDVDKLERLTKEDAKTIVEIDKKLKEHFRKAKEISSSEALADDTKKELQEDNAEEIKSLVKRKQVLLDESGFNKAVRAKARQNILAKRDREVKQAELGVPKLLKEKKEIESATLEDETRKVEAEIEKLSKKEGSEEVVAELQERLKELNKGGEETFLSEKASRLQELDKAIAEKSQEVETLKAQSKDVSEKEVRREYNKLFKDLEQDKKKEFITAYRDSKNFARDFARKQGSKLDSTVEEAVLALEQTDYYKNLATDKAKENIKRNFREETRKLLLEEGYFKADKQLSWDNVNVKVGKAKRVFKQKLVDIYANLEADLYRQYGQKDSSTFINSLRTHSKKAAQKLTYHKQSVEAKIKEVEKSKFTLDEVEQFLKARHAEETASYINTLDGDKYGVGGGLSLEKVDAILSKYSPEDTAEITKLADSFQEIVEDTRKVLVEGGLISEETANAYADFYDFYVPLTGFASDNVEIQDYLPSAKLTVQNLEAMRRGGKTIESENAIANVMIAYEKAVINAEKNKVLNNLAELKNLGNTSDGDTLFQIYDNKDLPSTLAKNPDSYVSFFENGEKKYLSFKDKSINIAFNRADVMKANGLLKAFTSLKHWYTSVLTTYNPDFILPNIVRDSQTAITSVFSDIEVDPAFAGIDSKKVMKDALPFVATGLGDVFKGISKNEFDTSTEKGRYAKEFFDEGGFTRYANLQNIDTVKKELRDIQKASEKFTKKDGVFGTMSKAATKTMRNKYIKALPNFVENVNGTAENMFRFAAFAGLRKQGVSKDLAAKFAAEMTIDFNQSGEWGSAASTAYFFFNASVQGIRRFFKTLYNKKLNTETGKKEFTTAQKMMASFVGLSYVNSLVWLSTGEKDEDDGKTFYEKQPEYIKETALRFGSGDDTVNIPVQYGFNTLLVLGDSLAELTLGKATSSESFIRVFKSLQYFLPVSISNVDVAEPFKKTADTVAPSLTQPFVDVLINKDYFNSPIYSEYDKPKEQLEDKMEYVISTFLGGVGKTFSRLKKGAENVGEGKEFGISNISIIRRFYSEYNPYQDISTFKDAYKSLETDYQNLDDGDKNKNIITTYRNNAKFYKTKINNLYKRQQALSSNIDKEYVAKESKRLEKLAKQAAIEGAKVVKEYERKVK